MYEVWFDQHGKLPGLFHLYYVNVEKKNEVVNILGSSMPYLKSAPYCIIM